MDAAEANRIRRHPQVLEVEQDRILTLQTTQSNPGWGLDRLDQATPPLNNTYVYSTDGAGQTIYILDSGLDLSKAAVAAEFGGRASIIYDVNGGAGYDCLGHGTKVASAAGGNIKGVAKGASLVIAKVTTQCTENFDASTVILALNWLAANAPRGTIANLSLGYYDDSGTCSNFPFLSMSLENAITAAYNAGIILVMAAGNDGCDTASNSFTRLPQAFVVGATDSSRLGYGQDAKASYSRTGLNISTFAPGSAVPLIDQNGSPVTVNGTSFSAPYIAGVFAVACQSVVPYCSSNDTGVLYQALRDTGILGTVTNADGTPLTGATSRFIWKQAW